jgi:hypothetical protein
MAHPSTAIALVASDTHENTGKTAPWKVLFTT